MASTISAGTTAGTSLAMAGDTSGSLQLQTNGTTTAVTIDTSQNVGIGTTSPTSKLSVSGTVSADTGELGIMFGYANSAVGSSDMGFIAMDNGGYGTSADMIISPRNNTGQLGNTRFYTAGTERMRIDSSGNVGIGTSTLTSGVRLISYNATNGGPATSGTTQASGAFRIQSGNNAICDFGVNGTTTWIQAADQTGLNTNYDIAMQPNGGNLLVGTTTASAQFHLSNAGGGGTEVMRITTAGGQTNSFYYPSNGLSGTAPSATSTVQRIWRDATTGRSINAAGTVNASGADYAEYMTKASAFTVAKGDVVGIDSNGKLTNVFADSVSFVVKSTNPSYVGNDSWGDTLEGDELEAARQTVDRIAFAGQVPVNVIGATAGQYIIPVNDSGAIKGQAVSSPTFEQYQQAVGKVIAIEADGRAQIIVKVA